MKTAKQKNRVSALLPILVFLIIYIGVGIYYEYIRPQEGVQGFYVMSVVVAFMAAIAVALFQNRSVSFDEKMKICASGMGDDNILTMIFIFLLAGAFSGVASASGCAADTANFLLSIVPGRLTVLGIFLIACIISMAMGTSCGTITVMGSLALGISQSAGLSLPLCFGALAGGSMFGDNLSFISDTTIAATKTQGCQMRDKFRENLLIALPAALAACVILLIIAWTGKPAAVGEYSFNIIRALPYFVILVAALAGINVFIVLGFGLILCTAIGLGTGSMDIHNVFLSMGTGVSGMYETITVTILATALSALIKYNGGFEAIIAFIRKYFHGSKGGQLGIILISMLMDISTANNTVAIVVTAPIATDIRKEYGITPKRTASLMDIATCIAQGIIPYGAQLLIAAGIAGVSSIQIMPYLFYPYLLFLCVLVAVFTGKEERV
ncbi:MAG: Na+/H+ antiporter NhaC family protein [Lachnospiraceae bacterium]|jgi:Na+/H+ antiporter NhaC|nr:Na+/H+ antiporter NhaC family protein [Lachnospiraceae bacterium]